MPLGYTTEELATLPTTPYRFVMVTWLVVGTAAAALLSYGYCLLTGDKSTALEIFNGWLIFLASLAGINVAQYGVKRATDKATRVAVAGAKQTAQSPQTATAEAGGTVVQTGAPAPATGLTGEHAAAGEVTEVAPKAPPPPDEPEA